MCLTLIHSDIKIEERGFYPSNFERIFKPSNLYDSQEKYFWDHFTDEETEFWKGKMPIAHAAGK